MANKDRLNHHIISNGYGVWYFRFKIRNGRNYKFSLKTKNVGSARKLRDQYIAEIRQHGRILESEPEANTFGEVAQEWVDWKRTKIGEEIRITHLMICTSTTSTSTSCPYFMRF